MAFPIRRRFRLKKGLGKKYSKLNAPAVKIDLKTGKSKQSHHLSSGFKPDHSVES